MLDDFTKADRHHGPLRHVRFQRHAGGETAGRPFRLRRRGADRLFSRPPDQGRHFPETRQIEAAESRLCLAGDRQSSSPFYDPGNQYAVNYMWGTTGIGYNVKDVKQILGPTRKIDSWDYVFDPDKIAKFKDCGIHLLDSSDDIMPAGLHYLHLDPNTSDPGDLQKVTDLLDAGSGRMCANSIPRNISMRSPPARSASPSAFPAMSSRRRSARRRPRAASRSAIRSRRRARSCGSTISPFRRTRRIRKRRTNSSIT